MCHVRVERLFHRGVEEFFKLIGSTCKVINEHFGIRGIVTEMAWLGLQYQSPWANFSRVSRRVNVWVKQANEPSQDPCPILPIGESLECL